MGNQNIKIRRISLTKRNRKISTIGEKLNISRIRDNIEESSVLIDNRMREIDKIIFDILQSLPLSSGFKRRELRHSYKIYKREKNDLQPLRDNLIKLLEAFDIPIKIESLLDQSDIKISHDAPNTFSPRSSPRASDSPAMGTFPTNGSL